MENERKLQQEKGMLMERIVKIEQTNQENENKSKWTYYTTFIGTMRIVFS